MKEIDFIPDWYTKGRKRRMSYQTQYAAILVIIAVMGSWSIYTARSVSNAQAQVEYDPAKQPTEAALQEYSTVKNEIAQLQAKYDILSSLDSHIRVANLIAEISFVADSRIVLTDLQIKGMPFESGETAQDNGSAVRVNKANQSQLAQGDLRFKCIIRGIASDAADVAKLISRMEDSAYFDQVIPCFSRTKRIKEHDATEFEISCFISNYRQEKK